MHTETNITAPPQRRYAGLALLRDEGGSVLLVERARRAGPDRFGLVGGPARPGEWASLACQREVREQTGLRLVPGRVLVVHYMPADGQAREGTDVVFDCGVITRRTPLSPPPGGHVAGYRWVAPDDLRGLVAPYTEWRINLALEALDGGEVHELVGHPNVTGALPAS
ncbi:NUDIX hydrolase [Streptomyces sp. DSM 44917]|uniref:NUDIX hydrolase n=1 Tax=Streptomyces boetiae TaxID=3075541 RepID=A0ABU2LAD0_9ACTN|nr:NUDIX hydrolase [Streptomyces sp. DSM 44917]MDT0308457.1 NUDIX hydrolase [Streptomyces sp. DSM 44917]